MRIGIIGLGAIGSYLVEKINSDAKLELGFVFDMDEEKTKNFEKEIVLGEIENFAGKNAELVVECASQEAVKNYAGKILEKTDLLILSVGALADENLHKKLLEICGKSGAKLYFPSGAIIGLDGIRAVRKQLENMQLITTKNPKSFGRDDNEKTVIFEGNARDACGKFPKNINVAAALALVGAGFEKTKVKIISDPAAERNAHHIIAEGSFGRFEIRVEAEVSGTPSTSSLAAMSAFEKIKEIQQN